MSFIKLPASGCLFMALTLSLLVVHQPAVAGNPDSDSGPIVSAVNCDDESTEKKSRAEASTEEKAVDPAESNEKPA